MRNLTQTIREVLKHPDESLMYEMSCRVAEQFPDRAILETSDYQFDLEGFVRYGMADLCPSEMAHNHINREWESAKGQIESNFQNGAVRIRWRGLELEVIRVQTQCSEYSMIVADEMSIAEAFFAAVSKFNLEIGGEVLVFRGGSWKRDWKLTEQISRARLEDLVLVPEFKADLVSQFVGFFAAKNLYTEHGVPWKRGVLLLGPPGNGKTMFIKAIANRLQVPILYVRGFESSRYTATDMMAAVFHRARQSQPCLLVFEDLDSMLKKENISFFLNEMDGLASNHGILTVATTNHPERLDPAILERPSRFDRKVTFDPPGFAERRQMLGRFSESWIGEMRPDGAGLDTVAVGSDGFSGAYVKEVCVSAMVAWMSREPGVTMTSLLLTQVKTLRSQMTSVSQAKDPAELDIDDDD